MFKKYGRLFLAGLCSLFFTTGLFAQEKAGWRIEDNMITTPWTDDVRPENPLPEYPRPQMARGKDDSWINLNGLWQYKIIDNDTTRPHDFEGLILVPFPFESSLSGVKRKLLPTQYLWYSRKFVKPKLEAGKRLFLHFGAVDWQATVYINRQEVGSHSGGYTAFSFDITDHVRDGDNEIMVKVFDPSNKGVGPHGKQTLFPRNIYYTPSSGIWQTVWLEMVPEQHITGLTCTPDIDRSMLELTVMANPDLLITAKALVNGKVVGQVSGRASTALELHVRAPHLWSPSDPFLYDLVVELKQNGKVIDRVASYFGMRKVDIQKDEQGVDRIFLNNRPYFNLGTLDQGFWPDGLYTAPTDDALKFDIEAIKAMGFNTIRKHIKVEPARWYYHADRLGILIWQDFVNPNQSLPDGAKDAFEMDVKATLKQLHNFPSITTWVIFNERWGSYDQQRVTEWIKFQDPTRIVNGHSGELLYVDNALRAPSDNPFVSSDVADVHSYPYPRNAPAMSGKARVLGEFGGIAVPVEGHIWDDLVAGWGYDGLRTPVYLQKQYSQMVDSLLMLKSQGLSASIYTQPFDVESEQNGLMTYDRRVIKLPFSTYAQMNARITTTQPTKAPAIVGDFKILVADTVVPGYDNRKRDFEAGERDSASLRWLAIQAIRKKDTAFAANVADEYYKIIDNKFSEPNVKFIQRFTFKIDDYGYRFLNENLVEVEKVLGKSLAENTIMRLIYAQAIKPVMDNPNHDLDSLEKVTVSRFGRLGEERIWATYMAYYLEAEDWANFGKYYKLYYDRAIPQGRSVFHINNMSWPVFENVNDTVVLKAALEVMAYNIEKYDSNEPRSYDTYANLLYKMGRKDEALNWQKMALDMSKDDEDIKRNYELMKKNVKTWK